MKKARPEWSGLFYGGALRSHFYPIVIYVAGSGVICFFSGMAKQKDFLAAVASKFPSERMTFQKGVATFHPESADEAAETVKLANQFQQKLFISGFANNIDPTGKPFSDMVVVRTDRLNRLEEIAPEDFYVRAGTGYPLHEINKRLSQQGLYFPHAALPYVGSVGGAVAVNVSAALEKHDLPIKRFLIQATLVTPEGEIITPGSVSFKSVSGYDIVKILAPSWGLLGLIVSATFRIMPISAAEEYRNMRMKETVRERFLAGFDESNQDTDAVYCRKIKNRFDPAGVLPIV
ncbi:MAG: FAD-binding oxidoreductase [Candidatus Zixiibacteriota bacterium]|nr:MAG: FAD-binding oxidoreductase [candidate division Zixibacteria bacterium]